MTPSEDVRKSSWRPPLSLVAIVCIIALISFSPSSLSQAPLSPFAITGQALLLIIGLRLFCYWPPMVRWIKAMPALHRVVFALVLGGMILGHYSFNGRAWFPYVAWEIFPFVTEHDPVTCEEFIATTKSGQKVRLLTEQLFPSIIQINPLSDARRFPPKTLDHLAHVLAHAYNEHHADDPVRHVDLVVMAVKLHPSSDESRPEPSSELLQCYEISSGQ